MKNKLKLFVILCITVTTNLISQTSHQTGAIFNKVTVLQTPKKAQLSFMSYRGMATSASLEMYCPTPGNQGDHGTCVAFANAYGIATILYAKAHNITNRTEIDKYIFSPTFLYEKIKNPTDNMCQEGTDPIKAIMTLMESGDPLLRR
jgi:hypothetical protein